MVFRTDERETSLSLLCLYSRYLSKMSFEEMEACATNTAGGEWRFLAELLANIQCLRVIIQVLNQSCCKRVKMHCLMSKIL